MNENDLPLSVGDLSVPRFPEFNDAERFREEAKALVISDGAGFKSASASLATVRALKDTLGAEKKRYLGPFNEGIKRLRDWFKPAEDALNDAELALNRAMSKFALEDQRRVREQEAEAERLAIEERKRLAKAADKAEDKGNDLKAATLRQIATVGVAAMPVKPQADSEDMIQSLTHKGRIMSFEKLVQAVAAGKAPITFLCADMAVINKVIQATKGEVGYPGIEIYQETQFRRARK